MGKKSATAPRNQAAAEARAKAQAEVRRKERQTLALIVGGSLIVVALFVGLVMFIVNQSQVADQTVEVADANYGIPIGTDGTVGGEVPADAVRVDIYADYRCPACANFEGLVGSELDAMREEGLIALYLHPVAILDGGTGGNSSLSGAAAAAVADGSPEVFLDFHHALFAQQPASGQSWSAQQLADLATSLGASDEVAEHIRTGAYRTWIRQGTEQASRDGMQGTPAVGFNGVIVSPDDVEYFNPVALRAHIEALASQS